MSLTRAPLLALLLASLLIVIAAALGACAARDPQLAADNAEQARIGSPYRYAMSPGPDGKPVRTRVVVGEPAPSRADRRVQGRILDSIAQSEQACGATAPGKLVETRTIRHDDSRVDEAWVVTRGDEQVAYLVTLELGEEVDFFVHGRCRW